MSRRSIEVKVGVLILGALLLLGAFVIVLGGLNLEPKITIHVDFENPGALQAGAPVRLASIRIGKVRELEFKAGDIDPVSKRPNSVIRAVVDLERRYEAALRDNSRFYVTTQGVLGETYLAVEPGSADRPLLKDGSVVRGVSPPRLDLLLAEGYELLHRAYLGITRNEDKIQATFDDLHLTLRGTSSLFGRNQDKLDSIIDNTNALSVEARETLEQARKQYIDNPRIARIIENVDRTTTTLDGHTRTLLEDTSAVMRDARKLSRALADDPQLKRYERIIGNLDATAANAQRTSADAQAIVVRLKRGEGTVGALLADEAVYDDIQELLRDLKRNPWKFFWKE